MLGLFLITKEEAFHICDKSQYGESTSWEKMKLVLRYRWCRATRAYVIRNNELTKNLKTSKLECLQYSERKFLKDRLKEQLKNQMQN